MKGTIVVISLFLVGLIIGLVDFYPHNINFEQLTDYLLMALMFIVGVTTGANKKTIALLKNANIKILTIPLSAIFGTWIGIIIVSLIYSKYHFFDLMAIGSGFGYYSLSSVLIQGVKGDDLATLALISNIFRELLTLIFTPIIAKYFGKIAPIASGGATSMDVTLPIITKYVGTEYAIISVFSGTVLTFLVPIFVTLFIKI